MVPGNRKGLLVEVAILIAVGLVGVLVVAWVVRYFIAVFRHGYRHSDETETPWWIPGQGGHGGESGQTPPFVPYNEDWDPKNRIP